MAAIQRTTTINKPLTSCSSSMSSSQMTVKVTVPPITTELKAYYFSDGEAMMDCILPTSWDNNKYTRGLNVGGMAIDRVSIEQAKHHSFNQTKVFNTVKRLIMKYSLNPLLALPRSHPVFVYDDRMSLLVKEIYERVKREVVDYHCGIGREMKQQHEESRLIFPTIQEQERFRFICKYFVSRCVLTMKMFQQVLESSLDINNPENLVYGELNTETLNKVTENDIEYPHLHCMIPYAMRHARIAIVSKLELALPRFMAKLIIHPMSMESSKENNFNLNDTSSLVKTFSFYSSQGLVFPVTFASSNEKASVTVMLAPVSGRKHRRDECEGQSSSKKSYINSNEDDSDCVVIFEKSSSVGDRYIPTSSLIRVC